MTPLRSLPALKTLWLSRRYSLTYWAKLYQPNPSACQRAGRHRRLGCSVDNSENLPLCSSGCHIDGSGRPSVGLTSEISWKVSELEEGFSARKPNSAKFSGDSEFDTRVNGCPVLQYHWISGKELFILLIHLFRGVTTGMFFRGLARQGRRVRAPMDGLQRSRKNISVVTPSGLNQGQMLLLLKIRRCYLAIRNLVL